jgi:hypothetical protein
MNASSPMNVTEIEDMKRTIEAMTKKNQIEVLKILSRNLCKINENKSGVYVNLSFLSPTVLDEMREFIQYIKQQEDTLNTAEYQKTFYKNEFFGKLDKEEPPVYYSHSSK